MCRERLLHPADEGQKPVTAVQGLHLLSFGTAYMIFYVHVHLHTCIYCTLCIHVHVRDLTMGNFKVFEGTDHELVTNGALVFCVF